MSKKIFIGSLPSGTKPEELRHLFEAFGVVTECDVMNRCGFVHMETPEMAVNAIKALNGTDFKGETINVEQGRVRDRTQKPGGSAGGARVGGGQRQRNGGRRMQNFGGMDRAGVDLNGIDERTTKDALQLCSAVFEEMNKLLNSDEMGRSGPRRRGGPVGFPQDFVEDQLGAVLIGMSAPKGHMNQGPRGNRNNVPQKQGNFSALGSGGNKGPMKNNANQPQRGGPSNQGNLNRGPSMQGRGSNQNEKNAGRIQNQVNQGFAGRNQGQNAGNEGRLPKQGNVGPIRNEPSRAQRAAAPYNRAPARPVDKEINFADDVPIAQNNRNFSNNLTGGSQIDGWPSSGRNFGGNSGGGSSMNRHPMNRNFEKDMPVKNFNDDPPIVINMVKLPSGGSGGGLDVRRTDSDNQRFVNQGNFGHESFQGSNDRFQSGNDRNDRNDRFQGSNNDRFKNNAGSNNDRFQSNTGSGSGLGNFGNQDRRGFALPEKQMFNDGPNFGNSNARNNAGNSMFGGQKNQSSLGMGNRNAGGFGNNNMGRQQSAFENRNVGSASLNSAGNNTFKRRNNNSGGNLVGNSLVNNRMRNEALDSNRPNNFGSINNRPLSGGMGGGNMNTNNNTGFNRTSSTLSNLHGPIAAINRNMGGNNGLMNKNMSGIQGNNRNMGGGMGNNNTANRNMGGNTGNIMNRNNMGAGNKMNNPMNPINFQKDFPALSGPQNMNNRNGPRQNMMSNRRY